MLMQPKHVQTGLLILAIALFLAFVSWLAVALAG